VTERLAVLLGEPESCPHGSHIPHPQTSLKATLLSPSLNYNPAKSVMSDSCKADVPSSDD
jgi:Mn-dependent DtxR family transcriptional regulator